MIDFIQQGSLLPDFRDDVRLYRCMCIDNGTTADNRMQVRPDFEGCTVAVTSYSKCPKFPHFFKGQTFTCRSYNDDAKAAQYVWVLATPDFSTGWILGPCYTKQPDSLDENYKGSVSLDGIEKFLMGRGVASTEFEYKNLCVINWFNTAQGGLIIFYHRLTGDLYIMNPCGVLVTIQYDKIFLRVGGASENGSAVDFSALTIDAQGFHFKSPVFEVDSKKVILGHRGLHLVGSVGTTPIISDMTGVSATPVEDVTM